MALVITAIAYSSAEAQNKRYTIVEKEVCKPTANNESITCYKNVSYYDNDVYQGELPTQVLIKKNTGDGLQYCEKSPGSNIMVCYNSKPNSETRTFYKMCRDDAGYGMYCTPPIPTNSTFPWSNL